MATKERKRAADLTAEQLKLAARDAELAELGIPLGKALGLSLILGAEREEFRDIIETQKRKVTVEEALPALSTKEEVCHAMLRPATVQLWNDFEEMLGLQTHLDQKNGKSTFAGKSVDLFDGWRSNKRMALDLLKTTLAFPMTDAFHGKKLRFVSEISGPDRHRADMSWFLPGPSGLDQSVGERKAGLFRKFTRAFTRTKFGFAGKPICILRHEHKDPGIFPVVEMTNRSYDLVEFWEKAREKAHSKTREVVGNQGMDMEEKFVKCFETQLAMFAHPICEMMHCMMLTGMRFGVLSVTRATWFLCHNGDGVLRVTKPYMYDGTGLGSVKLAYFSMLHFLTDDPAQVHAPPLVIETEWFKKVVHRRITDDQLEGLVGDVKSLPARSGSPTIGACLVQLPFPGVGAEIEEILPSGEHVHVERRIAHGADMVIKKLMHTEIEDVAKQFEEDMRILVKLRPLEEIAIPRLYHAGQYLTENLLVTAYAGRSFEACFARGQPIPDWAVEGALNALNAVHAAGVLHRDISRSNLMADTETQQVKLINFRKAVLSASPKDLAAEKRGLKRLLGTQKEDKS